jgi:hypothetical protein
MSEEIETERAIPEENVDEEQQENGLGTFASRALRGHQGALENSIAQQLVAAAFCTEPNKKITHVCTAAMATEGVMKIQGLDIDLMKRLYQVNADLAEPTKAKFRIDYYTVDTCVTINWSFPNSEQNFNDYIKPWYVAFDFWRQFIKMHRVKAYKLIHEGSAYSEKCDYVFAVCLTDDEIEKEKDSLKGKYCPKCHGQLSIWHGRLTTEETTVIDSNPFWSFFFEASQCLSEKGFSLLLNSFFAYAVPLVIKASSLILKTISPSTYEDALKFISGKKPEKVELESEGSLDQTQR